MRRPRRQAGCGASSGEGRAGNLANRPPSDAAPGTHAFSPASRSSLRVRRALGRELAAAVAFAVAMLIGVTLTGALRPLPRTDEGRRAAALAASFSRPTFLPHPVDNPPTPAKVALGKRLFREVDLSASGTVACASCHDPRLAFADGEAEGHGVSGRRLSRHTPSLWNVAFSPLLFWDGRASSLEEQVHYPVEHPDEMASTLDGAADRLRRRSDYLTDFAQAFPEDPQPSPRTIARALAAYERTLISPPTRFDQFHRRRRCGTVGLGAAGLCHLYRQGPLRRLSFRAFLHRPQLLRHRPAGRGQGARGGDRPAGGGPRL